jgi:hypothetical protein
MNEKKEWYSFSRGRILRMDFLASLCASLVRDFDAVGDEELERICRHQQSSAAALLIR